MRSCASQGYFEEHYFAFLLIINENNNLEADFPIDQ